jgi:FAD/FMN-containing dehydrogenase
VKCGGHHFSKANSVTDGVVIDMGAMREVKIDVAKNQVTVSGGCLWGDVYSALEVEGLVCVGGGVHVVGCGGHITGGWINPLEFHVPFLTSLRWLWAFVSEIRPRFVARLVRVQHH